MLDTNMATYLVSGRSQAARRTLQEVRENSRITLSAISQGELCFGLESKPGAFRLRSAIEEFLDAIQIIEWDSNAAVAYGRLRFAMSTHGKSLSAMDLLIAAHALATNSVLVTHDRAFLQAAPFVQVTDWATDL